jgi:hypothetical protein
MNSRRTSRVLRLAGIVLVVGPIALGLFGLVVKSLWNWLMPALFGVRSITFWQAWGVLLLSRILLGSFSGHHNDRHWRARLIDRWEKMSPEERERFREGLRRRWGAREEEVPES